MYLLLDISVHSIDGELLRWPLGNGDGNPFSKGGCASCLQEHVEDARPGFSLPNHRAAVRVQTPFHVRPDVISLLCGAGCKISVMRGWM